MSTSDSPTRSTSVRTALLALAVLLVSCGGGEEEATATPGPGDTAAVVDVGSDDAPDDAPDDGAVVGAAPDACSLVSAAQVEAIFGEAVEPSGFDSPPEEGAYSGCTWSNLPTLLGVQVAAPKDGINPLIILTSIADESDPAPVGREGVYYPGFGFIPGGGGVGQSVLFQDGPWTVLVGLIGDDENALDRAAMEDLAAAVEAALE